MTTVLERLAPGARVAVVRLRSLGDCVLTTPALSLLKQARPDLQIAIVVEGAFAPVFAGNPDVDAILAPKAAEIAGWRPELTVNLHGGATSVRLTLASRSRFRAGFNHFRFPFLYNVRIPRAQEILQLDCKVHTAEHLASAMFFLGVPRTEIPRARLSATPSQRKTSYAVLHPKASTEDKTWPAAKFLALADHLEKQLGIEPIFIAGPGESLEEFTRYSTMAGAQLEQIKALLAGAALFIGNDSGPAHMAAAFGLSTVVLFGSSDPEIWRPWRTEAIVLTSLHGIHSIDSPEVFRALEKLKVPQPK
jgi:ADP-heptose:LPS heptosyltransferase